MLIGRIALIYGTHATLQDLLMLSTPKRAEILTYLEERRDGFGKDDASGSYAAIDALIADIGGPNYRPAGDAEVPRWRKVANALGKYLRP